MCCDRVLNACHVIAAAALVGQQEGAADDLQDRVTAPQTLTRVGALPETAEKRLLSGFGLDDG